MSFLKIKDQNKRDETVKEFLELKNRIKDNFRQERIGEIETQSNLSKFFEPVTETQKATAKEITEQLKPIREGIEGATPQNAIAFPAFPSVELSQKELLTFGEQQMLYTTLLKRKELIERLEYMMKVKNCTSETNR